MKQIMKPDEIRALRKRMGKTQAEFGALIHHTRWSVMDWESGDTVPPPLVMERLYALEQENDLNC